MQAEISEDIIAMLRRYAGKSPHKDIGSAMDSIYGSGRNGDDFLEGCEYGSANVARTVLRHLGLTLT